MKRIIILLLLLFLPVFLSSCKGAEGAIKDGYRQINAEQAKKIMDEQQGYLILDVRTKEEFEQGHIPGAVLLPNEEIGTEEIDVLPDKDQLILVYCRSGNRSKQASQKLVDLGYTNIYEFGGINQWPYDIIK